MTTAAFAKGNSGLAQLRLRSVPPILSLFTCYGAVKIHLVTNSQCLKRGPKGIPSPQPGVPNPLPLYIYKLYQRELIPRQLLPSAYLSIKCPHAGALSIFYFKRLFPFPSMFCLGAMHSRNIRLALAFASFLSYLPSHLLTPLLSYLPFYLLNYSPLSLIKPLFLVFTLDIYIYITIYIISVI
jgi:hypothetical protein